MRLYFGRALAVLLLFELLMVAPPTVGQEPRPAPERPRASGVQRERVYLIQLNVVVTGPDGRFVGGLRRDDFSLKVDGRPMKIEAVDLEVVGPGGPPVATLEGAPPVEVPPSGAGIPATRRSRGIIFFFDGVNSRRGLGPEAIESARRFLRQGLPPGDEIMIVGLGRRFRIYQEFTTDGAAALAALDLVESDDQLRRGGEDRAAENVDLLKELTDYLVGAGTYGPEVAWPTHALRQDFAREEQARSTRFLEALQALSGIVRPREGRKEVFLFSDGLSMNPEESYGAQQAWGLQDLVLRTVRGASEARVVLNPVSTRGIPGPGTLDQALEKQGTEALGALALGTGGSLIRGISDHFEKPMRRVEEQTRAAYLLSFVPRGEPDGKLHSTRISAVRKGQMVRAPEGFLFLTEAQRRERETMSAYAVPENFRQLPVTLIACFFLEGKGEPAVEMGIEIPTESLLALPRERQTVARLEAGFVINGPDGKVRDHYSRNAEVRLAPGGEGPPKALTLVARRALEAGDYEAVAVVRDLESGSVGAGRFPFRVPALDSGHVAMSSLVLTRPASAGRGIRLDGKSQESGSTGVPVVTRVFHAPDQVSGYALVYHPRPDPVRKEIRVLIRGWIRRGNEEIRQFPTLRHQRPALESLVSIPVEFPLDLANLEPGVYELDVEAWDEVDSRGVKQSVEFLVR